jgi:hypothetical protein
MNKTNHFSVHIVTILVVSTVIFSINFNMAFPQNSNQNMMDQWPMMNQLNPTGMMGMESMMKSQAMMMPCMMIGPVMMGNKIMLALMPCMVNPGLMGMAPPMMGMAPPMMGMAPPMMGMAPPMMGMAPPMMNQLNQTEMMGMESLAGMSKK